MRLLCADLSSCSHCFGLLRAGTGTTTFEGEFVSSGGTLDFSFDGIYRLFSFHQNGAAVSPQCAESALSAALTIEDLTAASGITSETVFSDSLIRASFGVSRKDNEPFSGMRSVDLSSTSGHTIKATFTTTARGTAYAGRVSFETQSATGAQSSAGFDELNFAFDLITVPGLSEDDPVMPDATDPDGTKVFINPDQTNAFIPQGAQNAGLWFDPPPTSELQLTATEGLFLELGLPTSYPDSNGEYHVVAPGAMAHD